MQRSSYQQVLAGIATVLVAGWTAHGGITITIGHHANRAATPAFQFKNVPSPSANDAATRGKFIIVSGARDENGATLEALNDGRLPTGADQPGANFFFQANTQGGRLLLDLGRIVDIKQINTYSWHPSTRGPQVYQLYASDGHAADFNPDPAHGVAPESCGWQQIARVDTRPKHGYSGGQYGVSIADSQGAIGRYRYLLFDVAPTEDSDPFGNTFYSEIDVVDAHAKAASKPAFTASAYHPFVIETTDGKCKITINTYAAPGLRNWADHRLAPVLAKWYPKIVALLPSKGFTPPTHYTVTLRPGRGVAATSGTHVVANSTWFRTQIGGQAIGALVHETVHVVQQYGWGRRHNPHATRSPWWLVEGMADYIRWFKYEPQSHGADIVWMRSMHLSSPRYDAGYRVTANFLNWVTEKYDTKIVTQLNAKMRNGDYRKSLWKQYTGKSLDDLGAEWAKEIKARLSAKPTSGVHSMSGA